MPRMGWNSKYFMFPRPCAAERRMGELNLKMKLTEVNFFVPDQIVKKL